MLSVSREIRLNPVIVQDLRSAQVLMLAYANDEALELTRSTGLAHFFSRSRKCLWKKGETSGHVLPVVQILEDCDQDAWLYVVDRVHPVCHRNTASCFGSGEAWTPDPLKWIDTVIRTRISQPQDPDSYTQQLAHGDPGRILQKVGEEAVEVAIAGMKASQTEQFRGELVAEMADLLYHLSVAAVRLDVSWSMVMGELSRRHATAGRCSAVHGDSM